MVNVLLQVNPEMVPQLESAGMSFTGKDETGQRMEVRFQQLKFFKWNYLVDHLEIFLANRF